MKDESYPWFLHWMTAHQRALLQTNPSSARQKRSFAQNILQRFTPRIHHLSVKTDVVAHPNGSVQTHFSLLPGPGKHVLRFRRAFLLVERIRETKALDLTRGGPWETITLTTLYSQRHVLQDLLEEAHRMAVQSNQGKTIIYASRGLSWEMLGEPRRKRPLDSVILDRGVKERILADMKDFLSSEKWYHERGIPHRRGYLLYGSPGSGKSSVIQALAGELDYNIATLNLSERGLTDDRLNYLLTKVPQRTIVLLEDADAAFSNRRTQIDTDGYQGANVTFSGLLNAIDGVSSVEERLLFLTTNHVDRLDEALIRPGRVDMTVQVAEASRWQAAELWDRFYGRYDEHKAYRAKFLQQLAEWRLVGENRDSSHSAEPKGLSMAALQGLFLYNKDNMTGAIEMVKDLGRRKASTSLSNERQVHNESTFTGVANE